MKQIHAVNEILYAGTGREEDKFREKIESTIADLESFLRPRLWGG